MGKWGETKLMMEILEERSALRNNLVAIFLCKKNIVNRKSEIIGEIGIIFQPKLKGVS